MDRKWKNTLIYAAIAGVAWMIVAALIGFLSVALPWLVDPTYGIFSFIYPIMQILSIPGWVISKILGVTLGDGILILVTSIGAFFGYHKTD